MLDLEAIEKRCRQRDFDYSPEPRVEQDIPDLIAEVKRLREGLNKLEWAYAVNSAGQLTGYCPVCHKHGQHWHDCWLAKLIGVGE